MKKLLFMLIGVAAAINAMAVTYTAKANLLLEAGSKSCEINLRQSDEYGALSGYDMYMAGRQIAIYTINGDQKLQFAQAADFTNVRLGLKTNASTDYTITVTGVEGSQTLVLYDLLDMNDIKSYTLTEGKVINFSAAANATDEERFVINYVAPAPTCNTVRDNLENGRYYTICLDKEIASFNGASFWSLNSRGVDKAYLVEEQAPLAAGKPYIFQAEAEELCVVYGVGSTATAGVNGALHGTFVAMDQAALTAVGDAIPSAIYLLYNNELVNVSSTASADNSLAANRAYIVYDELEYVPQAPAAPGRRVRAIPMQGQVVTGVENINTSEVATKFVENGQIFIRRGNEVFNLQGQVVK